MPTKGWGSIILAAISAYYFGWLKGRTEIAVQPGELTIEGKKILIPRDIYDQIQSLIGSLK